MIRCYGARKLLMPELRSLEDWAEKCTHKPASVRVDSWRAHLLCRDCAHAYAEQEVVLKLTWLITQRRKGLI